MTKGKFGIYLWFYAVLAFILTFLGQTLLCGLLLGFVIVAEKNEWLSRQVIQAFVLSLAVSIINSVFGIVTSTVGRIPLIGSVLTTVFGVVEGLISLLVLVLVIVALLKVSKQQEANIPGLSTLANKAFGIVEQKVYSQMPPQQFQQQIPPQNNMPPQYNNQYQQQAQQAPPQNNVPPQNPQQ